MLGLILEELREVLRIDAPKRQALHKAMNAARSHMEEDDLANTELPAESYIRALMERLGLRR